MRRIGFALALLVLAVTLAGCGESAAELREREQQEHYAWLADALDRGLIEIEVLGERMPDGIDYELVLEETGLDYDVVDPDSIEQTYCDLMSLNVSSDDPPSFSEFGGIKLYVSAGECLID